LGHEYCGVVEKSGVQVAAFTPGDRVAIDPNYRCGHCEYCKSGASNLCDSSEANLFDQRGLATYVDLHESYLFRLPLLDPPFLGALLEPLSCALHAISLAAIRSDDRILILGCGGQGSMLVFALSVLHPALSIALYDPLRARCRNLVSIFEGNGLSLNRSPSAPEYTLVFEASGRSTGFKTAALSLSKGGRIIVISRYRDRRSVYLPHDFPRKQPQIIFSHLNGDGQTFTRALKLLSDNWKPEYQALVQIKPLAELPQVLAQADQSPFSKTIFKMDDESLISQA
jgi:threonine dehydrogenase-like Zn-dependent dehydrogenase